MLDPLFYIVLHAVPAAGSPHAAALAFAKVHAFAYGASEQEALDAVRGYVMDQLWISETVEFVQRCTPERIADFEILEAQAHRRAMAQGVGAYFVAGTHEDTGNKVEIRSMGKPPLSDPTGKH